MVRYTQKTERRECIRRFRVVGLGTWRVGETGANRTQQLAAICHAVELGYRLFDTAEMYGDRGAERVLGQALGEAVRAGDVDRASLLIVSKVYPPNASRRGMAAACDRSLERMDLDRIDLYLLHLRGQYELQKSVDGFQRLRSGGLIGRWGQQFRPQGYAGAFCDRRRIVLCCESDLSLTLRTWS